MIDCRMIKYGVARSKWLPSDQTKFDALKAAVEVIKPRELRSKPPTSDQTHFNFVFAFF